MAMYRGRVEAFHDDQLVVALPDLRVVTQVLADLGVRCGPIDASKALGLALIRDLDGVGRAAGRLAHDPDTGAEIERFRAERSAARPGTRDVADLELLIKGIRAQLTRRFPGWEVTIGKNYGPSMVKGHPHIDGGGDGDPQPTSARFGLPASERGRGVRVGLLDTRLFPVNSLNGHYIATPDDLVDLDGRQFTMFDGHCAFVASCILGRAPAAELLVHHVLDSKGEGSTWEAAKAVAEAAGAGLDVVNLSLGEFLTDDNSAPMVLETAVKRLGPETVVVAAAGNNGDVTELTPDMVHEGVRPNSASYPAALPDVVGVGALGQDGKRAAFTPDPAPWITLLAPGVGLTGAYVQGEVLIQHRNKDGDVIDSKPVSFGGTAIWEGCSFAAGIVSGEIAARTVPGHRSAREALDELLHPDPGKRGCGILPNNQPGS
jgi:membrane-anchored mycosin MYCP